MRADNLIIVVLGLAAVAFGVACTVRWSALPTRSTAIPPGSDRKAAFATAGWSIAAVLAAGAVAGIVIGGIGGRLIMRVAAAVSEPEVQGRLTDADETIGEITLGGTLGFIVFVGLGGGIVTAGLYLLARPWLPAAARATGAMMGVLIMGLAGPGDPLDPENIDFALLSFDALSVAMILAGALLFGLTFASLAARFDVVVQQRSRGRFALLPAFVLALMPAFGAVIAAYVAARTILPGSVRPALDHRGVQIAGRVLLMAAVALAVVRLAIVSVDIIGG